MFRTTFSYHRTSIHHMLHAQRQFDITGGYEKFSPHMIIILHLSTGAYCSSRKPNITIANRPSSPLRSFSRRSIHPFNLALSSLPLLFSSLCSSFPGPPQASYPSSPPTLFMGSHSIPFANNGKCLSLNQTLSTTVVNN